MRHQHRLIAALEQVPGDAAEDHFGDARLTPGADHDGRYPGQGTLVVRQQVGLLDPHARHGPRLGQCQVVEMGSGEQGQAKAKAKAKAKPLPCFA